MSNKTDDFFYYEDHTKQQNNVHELHDNTITKCVQKTTTLVKAEQVFFYFSINAQSLHMGNCPLFALVH
jgi:uncharacterized protein YktB (UPF0637 family)